MTVLGSGCGDRLDVGYGIPAGFTGEITFADGGNDPATA